MKKSAPNYWGKHEDAPVHPYVEFDNTPLWRAVKEVLSDLENNQDLAISEWHQYVVGYVCKQLAAKKLVSADALKKPSRKARAG